MKTEKKTVLFNGIELSAEWPPRDVDPMDDAPAKVPYLISRAEGGTRPDVIDISVGRQLFVDDFLVENTDLSTVYHQPEKYEGNPILSAETPTEKKGESGVGTGSGGVWYDMDERKYKMWYDVLFNPMLAYAESTDGVHWERVNFRGDGTNIVMTEAEKNGACSVFIDYDAPKEERYKLFLQSFHDHFSKLDYAYFLPDNTTDNNHYASTLFVSADGLHWKQKGEKSRGLCGDMTTVFYDALRKKWVNSIRTYAKTRYGDKIFSGRVRYYDEHDRFEDLVNWHEDAPFWIKCDRLDPIDDVSGVPPQMYNFDAVAYESILFGFFQIWRGPENHIIARTGDPKITELLATFSRDGFHIHRPDRTPFIAASRTDGAWDKGYLHCSNGGVIVHDDTIDFYYSGFSGFREDGTKSAHAGQAIGKATLRRDGFASLRGAGCVTTRPLTVHGGKKYLFVNLNVPEGSFRAELLDGEGRVIPGFGAADCLPAGGNATKKMLAWKGGTDLSFLNDTTFRVRFTMEKGGDFFAFWISDSTDGASGGAVAAGYVSH